MIGAPIGGSGIGGVTSIDTFAPFLLRPDGDTATDGWTNEADSASNIYQSVDEVTASDSDFVQSPRKVSATSSPTTADLKVRLYDGATMIVEWTHTDIGAAYVDVEQTLTAPQYAAITGFANLFLEFDDNQSNVYRFQLADPPLGADQPVKVKYRYKKIAG
jgi:hypothetical protein